MQSVAHCRAASVGVGSGTETLARDVSSLSDFTLKAQLCKWLTAYIQNAPVLQHQAQVTQALGVRHDNMPAS